jgi:hypothetical protein
VVKQLGCGPSAKLWIIKEGALEESIDVTFYYEEGDRHCDIVLFASQFDTWFWQISHGGPRRKMFLWDLLPERKGTVPKGWSPANWELDFRRIRREFRRTMKRIHPNGPFRAMKDTSIGWDTVNVCEASCFDISYDRDFLKRGTVTIKYHGAFEVGHPVNVCFLTKLNPKLKGLIKKAELKSKV